MVNILILLQTTPCATETCTPATVSGASYLPNQASFSEDEIVTYTCNTGYDLTSGDPILSCYSNGTWNGTTPICTIKTCAAVDIAYGTRNPVHTQYNYNTDVTYSCDEGYAHASGDLVRTCMASKTWNGTKPVCAIETCAAVDIVYGTRNPKQAQYNYNTNVTYSCDEGYAHASGDLVRTCLASKIWSGTEPICTIVSCSASDIAFSTKLPASSTVVFNTTVTYICDVGFNLTSGDAVRSCQASGDLSGTLPVCTIVSCSASDIAFSTKLPAASSTVVFNNTVMYICDVGYNLTSGDAVRSCQASGDLSGTLPVCTIVSCSASDIAFSKKLPASSTVVFNTTVTYMCDVGYNLTSGDAVRSCKASGDLSGTLPVCTIVNCSASDIALSTKLPASSTVVFNTTVTYICDVGYNLTSGNGVRTCQASGDLSGTLPVCTIVNCSASDITFGSKLPASSTVVFNTTVTYTCDVGYNLTSGDGVRTCQASGDLSGTLPVCTIKTCASEVVLNTVRTPSDSNVDFNTTVSYACDLGYNHTSGDLTRICQANSTLSGDAPTCILVTCAEPANITHATKSPVQSTYDYSEQVTYTCETGYKLDTGDLDRTCTAEGTWSGALPACIIVTCAVPSAVAHSSLAPVADPYIYNTVINYTCDTGYEQTSGSLSRTCEANGAFSGTAPVCSIKQCAKEAVVNGTPDPDQPLYNYNTAVLYECNLGFNHTSGDLERTCNASANWNGTLPVCTVAACLPENITLGSFDPPGTTHEFGSNITYTCDLGYYISAGDANRTCQTDGSWTNTLPTCSLVRCNAPDPVPFSSHTPPGTLYDYNTDITYTCDLAYNNTGGNLTRTCTEHFTWTGAEPNCTIAACIQENSTYMGTTPDKTLHEFTDGIIYECILGYNHSSGDLNRTCQNDGDWTGIKPECIIVTCAKPNVPAHASITPDAPEVIYNTYITYVCDLGYNRTDGDETRRCTENATFEGAEANCTLVTCDPPDAIGNGTYSPELTKHDYNTTVNFTCDFGYYHSSGDLIQRCDENANWVNPKPVCEIVKCSKPTEAFATVSPDQSLYNFNTSVTSTCVIGYNLTDGDANRTCQHTGAWDGIPPNCTIVECDAPPPVPLSSLTPHSAVYVYLDTLTYTCDTGYELTSGDDVRTCTETGEWTGSAPNCTIIHCPIPPSGVRNTYSPDLLDYIWNDTIVYACDIGYNHSTGDLISTCQHDKNWSAVTPVCLVVTCDKIDVPLMTFDPPTADTHDFNTTIEYACVIGYNHSYGDLFRTCNYTGEWTGTLPNCTIITCDPPDPIPHTSYLPVQVEHDWNTSIHYSCHPDYHYVSGVNTTTCNESGSFPPVDLSCSVQHFMAVAASEPALTWINSTVTQTDTAFDFDDMCDVTITCVPDLLGVTHTISASQIIMTVAQTASTVLDEYVCTLAPFRGERTFPTVNRDVFFGNAIVGFQAWVDHTQMYLKVGDTYHFEANATKASLISVTWVLADNVTRNFTYTDEFAYMDLYHQFTSPTTNVTVSANNAVSSVSVTVPVIVIYALNGINFTVNEELRTTTESAHFELDIDVAADIPMAAVNVTLILQDGNAPANFILDIQDTLPASLPHQFDVIYDVQGYYNVTAIIENPVSSVTFNKYMSIWDKLDTVKLVCSTNCPNLITNTSTRLRFDRVPRSGFEYLIDMKDTSGTTFQNYNSSILYELYSVIYFDHIYTLAGRYKLRWSVSNGGYTKAGAKWITVQNKITDFQAYLDYHMIYLAVWDTYTFIANATDGTSVYLDWDMELNVTETQSYSDTFSTGNLSYSFQKPKNNITVTARNLVSSFTRELFLEVFYKINNFNFTVPSTLGNTTTPVQFELHLMPTAYLPMNDVNITINFKHGNITTESRYLDTNYGVDVKHFYSHLFDVQGTFLVEARLESILGNEIFNISMSCWDSLLPLELEFVNAIGGKYIITNTVSEFNFTNVPNYGYKYSIDYGDGTVESNVNDSILYSQYNLSLFTHVFTSPGVYIVNWVAYNGEPSYNRDEHFAVHVQNPVPDTNYTLEPLGKKYPWTVVQTLSIGLNITLNASVPLPTNTTCVFNPGDGNSSVTALTFDNSFFEYSHDYRTEGFFNTTLYCSNDVSDNVYIYDIEIKQILASEIKLVFHDYVPLNVSETVVVYFHIDNGGYELLPKYVYLTWDYGDGSTSRRRRASVLYDKLTYDHLYSERGNYTVSVFVEALASNTTNTVDYSLRLGLMYFEYNTTVQFLDTTVVRYTMYGVPGTTTYTIDFDDGTTDEPCTSSGPSGCDIHHLCPSYGYKLIQVVASNGTFIELDNMNMTCDNPIVNITTDIPYTVAIPNGTVDAMLRIKENDLFLPQLYCIWNMGDPIHRDNYRLDPQEVTYEDPYLFNFQYIALGRHTITIFCWNLINDTRLETQITVTNKDFLFTGVFDRFYSQSNSPMYISSMIDTEIFSRLEILASSDEKTHTNLWQLGVSLGETNPNRHGLLFTRGLVPEGKYYITLKVCFIEERGNCIFEPTYAEFVMPPLHAEIAGSTRRYVDRGPVTIDAFTLSYDPVYPELTNLEFIWSCKCLNAASFEEADFNFTSGAGSSCTYTETSTGVLTLDTNANPVKSYYAVTVTVNNTRGMTAEFTQILVIQSAFTQLTIKCKVNCLSKVARSSKLQLVPDLPNNCPASFTWTLKKYSGSTYDDVDISSFISDAGSSSRSLTIKENMLEYGTWYMVSLTVSLSGVTYGPAYYEFLTNRPPQGGFCTVTPFNVTTLIPMDTDLKNTTTSTGDYKLTASIDLFNISCQRWEDEGFTDDTFSNQEPIFYVYFLSYGDDQDGDTKRQLVYFDPGQTSNLVTFQVGNVNDEFRATVVVRITDVFGDYTDVRYNVKSKPPLTTAHIADLGSDGIKRVVSEYVEQFDENLIKANRTQDYRTISRYVMDISSVYNELSLNTSSGIILSPEDLLSLGYVRTEDDKLLSWQDYWKIIVEVTDTTTSDYLVEVGEQYAYMLHASVTTWPSSKRMTLVAIETISRALNASTSKLEFSNVTAAILGAECANILARNLAEISDDRTFPNTEQLFSAAISVRDLIRNSLAILQTVLTPNLPQDPTVDEMRNYLEYIRIFKTTEEVLNAPLSIQEQTFLAQKQLQKYYLQKYIKSEASKRALPHLTYALRNLTYVLGRMTVMGREEISLENDYVYISVKFDPAYELVGKTISRPRVALELNGLQEDNPETCNSSEVLLRTIVFKHNPYFWGDFADRITSYVPLIEIDGASLTSDEITYRLENKVEANCKDQDPTYEVDDPDKMIYILFDRQHAEDDILIFVRPNTSELIYELYFNKDDKPKISENLYSYSTEMIKNDETWTLDDGYKLLIKSSEYSETGKIWIGLRPLLENSADLSLLTRKFCANVTSVSCLAWRQKSGSSDYEWDKDRCEVSLSSTRSETVCTCQNTRDILTAGTTFYVPYNMIDFKSLDDISDAIGRAPVIGMMIATVCAYILLVIWAWREDVKDQYKWSYSLMVDNDIADSYFYIIRVFTGLRTSAGTQSKIAFVLVGEDGDTNIRILDDDSHIGFERGSVRTFVMSTRKYLGDLLCLRIWHDDSGGNNSSWYLNKINVTDLKSGKRFAFVCNQWFDYDSGDTRVDRLLNAQPYEEVRSYQDMISYTIAENHLWISVVIRPLKSNFTRIQRLSCLLGLIYLTMIICTMILETPNEENTLIQVVIGPFRFSMENFKAALIAVTVSSVVIIIVSFFFKNAESDEKTPNLDSVIRRAYRKVNDKFKLDQSVLARRYWSPAEQTLEYNYFFLPHMCVYVGWIILVMSLIVATYLLVAFSSNWALVKSEEWMTAVFVSMLCSILLIEGAKIIIILLAYSLLCQRAYEPPEPYIDIDSLEEITKYNSATLTIGPQFSSVLHKPENPSKATLLKNQVKRIRNHQLLKIVSQLVVYGALLYLVYTISFESRDPRSFYLKDHVQNLFHFESEVTDLESYTTWLKGTFIDTYFSNSYFGAEYEGTENKQYMEDLSNMRVGPARLRQLRIKPEDCIGPLGVNLTCHNKYEETKKETQDFCLGWHEQPCPVSEKSTYFTSPAWEYTSADEVWGFPTVAQYCTFGGGGYFMKLDVNREVCDIIFSELVQFSWFDEKTRGVILEFTLYNANTNLFVYSKFVAEFPEVGGFLPYIDIQVFRLYLNSGPDGDFILFLQFFFLLIVIAATFVGAYELFTDFRAFFKSMWNILDLVALIMSYVTISIFIYKIFIIKKTIDVFESDKNAYVGFENLAFYDFITNTAYGILVFLLSVRVSRILGYSGKINEMADVITTAANDLYGFLLIFAITYFAYVICGTMLFGKEQEKYKDLFQTYGTLTEAIVGKNRVSNILTAKPGFAEFYYFTFVLFVLMTLATMAAAILNFSISAVRAEQQKLAPTNIVEVIFDRMGKILNKIMPSKNKTTDEKRNERRDSDAELTDILSDLRIFIGGLRSKKKKKEKSSDKYKLTGNDG